MKGSLPGSSRTGWFLGPSPEITRKRKHSDGKTGEMPLFSSAWRCHFCRREAGGGGSTPRAPTNCPIPNGCLCRARSASWGVGACLGLTSRSPGRRANRTASVSVTLSGQHACAPRIVWPPVWRPAAARGWSRPPAPGENAQIGPGFPSSGAFARVSASQGGRDGLLSGQGRAIVRVGRQQLSCPDANGVSGRTGA